MALALPQSDMGFDFTSSPPTTPITQPPFWDFRPTFNPKPRSSGKTSGRTWSPSTDATAPYSSRELAAILQFQFDEENRLLLAERAELAAAAQRVFDCAVCMDTLPEESMARIDPCGHPFCRDCVRGLIESQIESRRFPVLCPACTAGPGNDSEAIGKVTRELVLDIGLTEEQYETWVEMEMSEFLIRLQCRRCTHTSFFDKEEFDEAKNLTCPRTDCNYVWCKDCQQEIIPGGPEHSCDGSSELEHLVQEQGWKFCPTCRTPCEKISGCNFMSCISPGCNSHFCYNCGDLVIQSAVPAIIAQGKAEHWNKCPVN